MAAKQQPAGAYAVTAEQRARQAQPAPLGAERRCPERAQQTGVEPRRRDRHRGLRASHGLDHGVRILADRQHDRRAAPERGQNRHQERIGAVGRGREENAILRPEPARLGQRLAGASQAVATERQGLGRAGRARGLHDGRAVAGRGSGRIAPRLGEQAVPTRDSAALGLAPVEQIDLGVLAEERRPKLRQARLGDEHAPAAGPGRDPGDLFGARPGRHQHRRRTHTQERERRRHGVGRGTGDHGHGLAVDHPAAEQAGREPRHRPCELGEGTGLERAVADRDQRGRLAAPGERVHPGGQARTGRTGVPLSGYARPRSQLANPIFVSRHGLFPHVRFFEPRAAGLDPTTFHERRSRAL